MMSHLFISLSIYFPFLYANQEVFLSITFRTECTMTAAAVVFTQHTVTYSGVTEPPTTADLMEHHTSYLCGRFCPHSSRFLFAQPLQLTHL